MYADSFDFRRDVIYKAYNALRAKNPVEFHKKAEKKFGPIYPEVYGLMYELHMSHCLAVVIDKIDEAICKKHGFETMAVIRERQIAELRKEISNV